MILDEVVKRAIKIDIKLKVQEIFVGYPYTFVIATDLNGNTVMGTALTPILEISEHEVWNPPKVLDLDFKDIFRLATSMHMIERTIGLASINAASQYLLKSEINKLDIRRDIIEILVNEGVSNVAVVGKMSPIIKKLHEKDFNVIAFERDPKRRTNNVFSDCLEPRFLPEAEAVVITGAALLNDTLDIVLSYAKNSKVNVLIGPTAQQHPHLLENSGLDYVVSCLILDVHKTAALLKITAWREALHPISDKHVRWYTLKI